MPASGWTRRWKTATAMEERKGALIRVAARGDSLDQLVEVAVQELLESCSADRAGLWLAGERRGAERVGGEWSKPNGVPSRSNGNTSIFLRPSCEPRLRVGSRCESKSAGKIRCRTSVLGRDARRHMDSATCRRPYARSGHGGLRLSQAAIQFDWNRCARARMRSRLPSLITADARKRELAAEELRSLARLSRAILCGVSVDSILPQIARAARHHMQAEFVALGRPGVSPMLAESWDGPEEWRASVQTGTIPAHVAQGS